MPDVGVLNLQIHDDSAKAAQGLDQLVDVLNRVKSAVNFGGQLGTIANNLSKLGKIIDESFQGSTIAKLNEMATALQKMKDIGKVNIRISYGKEDEFAAVARAFEKTEAYSHGIMSDTKGFGDGFEEADRKIEGVENQLQETLEIIQNLKWAAGGMGEAFNRGFAAWNNVRMNRSLGAGSNQIEGFIGEAEKSWTLWKDGAIEAEGTVTDAADNISGHLANMSDSVAGYLAGQENVKGEWETVSASVQSVVTSTEEVTRNVNESADALEYAAKFQERVAEMAERAAEASAIREQQEAPYKVDKKIYTPEETDNMASYVTTLNRLEAEVENASKTYNRFVNTLGAGDLKTIKAAEALNKAREAVEQYRNSMEAAEKAKITSIGIEESNGVASTINQYDLLTAKVYEAQAAFNALANDPNASGSAFAKGAVNLHKAESDLQKYNELQEMLKNVSPEIQQFAQSQLDAGVNATTLRNKLFDLDGELKKKKKDFSDAKDSANVFSATLADLKKGTTNLFAPLTKLGQQFVNIAKRMAMRAIIRQFTSSITEGVENVYQYSKAVGGSLAPSMDSAATSLAQMKNSVGAALAPALEALIPVLNTIVSWFITAINYVNQFFALLRGQTSWIRALEVSTKAYDKSTKQAQKTAKAAKELLADWDELNIIQSQGGGGGGGGAFKLPTDYSKMFEEVETFDKKIKAVFDFIKENLADVKRVVMDIGAALLAWKLSNSLTGWLSTLATIATVGFIIKLAFDAAGLLDQAYIDSDNIGFLIGDAVLTGALAGIGGKLMAAKFGDGIGLITAGLTFAVSAGATFASIGNAKEDSQREALTLLGAVKAGIATALTTAAFVAEGFSLATALTGGILAVGLTVLVTYSLKVTAEAAERAEEMAKNAFASTGEGGIKASDYTDALQKEFDKQTEGAKIVLNAYVEVPDLKDKLTTAASQISSFNQIIFKGDGKFTKEDAESFKENWGIVLDTLKSMDTSTYNTILQGLTEALQTKNEELRAEALEIRKTFIMIEKNITAENADIYTEMESIAGRLGTAAEKAGDLERYEQLYKVFAASTQTGFEEIQKALDQGKNIDFGNAETAVSNAAEFIKSVGESGNAALDEVQKALDAVIESIDYKKRMEKAKLDAGLITQDVYDSRMTAFDNILAVAQKYAEEKTKAIQEKMNEAYSVVFDQALKANTGDSYWKTVMLPLIQQAREAGVEVPQTVIDAFTDAINSTRLDTGVVNDNMVNKILSEGLTEPGEIANAIKTSIESEFGAAESDLQYLVTNFFIRHTNLGLDETNMQIKNLIGLQGWDLLSKQWKQLYTDSLVEAFGKDTTREILEQLTTDRDEILALLGEQNPIENDIPVETTVHETVEIVTEETKEEGNGFGPNLNPFEEYHKGLQDVKDATEDTMKDLKNLKPEPPKLDTKDMQNNAGDAATSVEDMATRIRNAFQSLNGLSFSFNAGNQILSGFISAFIPPIPHAANGGIFKSGDVFSANENGNAELIGSYGNRTAVVNNDQVVGAVTNGVAQANSGVESRLGTIETLLNRILQKEFTAKAVPSASWGQHAARSADAYSKVTG